ncbi:MAG: FAD binding domain-containing protein [Anaerolineales bacterium]|jgi:CO/xanthine dehydrogenase FAD-binding subunit
MSPVTYERPENLSEALKAIKDGSPLGGGTRLTSERRSNRNYVDLQDAGLDQIETSDQGWVLGAMVRIQALVESRQAWPPVLSLAARHQAGWNIRNQASLGGLVMAGDGRSPLLTCLLAAGAEVHFEPQSRHLPLEEFLGVRDDLEGALVTSIKIPALTGLAYEQVARSPADRPIVCAAAGKLAGDEPRWLVALGGFGEAPQLIYQGGYDLDACVQQAAQAYEQAGDEWATSDYRGEIAPLLAARVLGEVK